MKSRKHLVFLTAALLLGTLVASAKPGPKPPKAANPCKGFFEAPFVGSGGQVAGSEGKLCYWENDPTLVHAKVEIPAVQSNRTYCVYLAEAEGMALFLSNGTDAFARLLFRDGNQDNEIFFDDDICVNGCGDEGLDGSWVHPAFWVFRPLNPVSSCHPDTPNFANATPVYATGFVLPDESF